MCALLSGESWEMPHFLIPSKPFPFHVTRLAKTNEIRRIICFLVRLEFSERTDMMNWKTSSNHLSTGSAAAMLPRYDFYPNVFPATPSVSLCPADPIGRIWSRQTRMTIIVSACVGAEGATAFHTFHSPGFSLKSRATIAACKSKWIDPFGISFPPNLLRDKRICWTKPASQLIAGQVWPTELSMQDMPSSRARITTETGGACSIWLDRKRRSTDLATLRNHGGIIPRITDSRSIGIAPLFAEVTTT